MELIKEITDEFNQFRTVVLPNGKTFDFTMIFAPMQRAWFATFTYQGFTISNVRICTSPNFLRQFKNLIPFGMACSTENAEEPLLQQDFLSGRSQLFLLNTAEVQQFEDALGG